MSRRNTDPAVEREEIGSHPVAKSGSAMHSLACVAVLLVSVLVTRPFVEMGVDDDFSYTRTAQLMAQTGHFVYNGWAAPILGWQMLLGALFIKVFGFSFTVVRMATVCVALATTYLLHRLLLRFGSNAWNATVGTLAVVLSPIFLPLVPTFMTDVAGFFAILVCLYCCLRALQAGSGRASLGWLCSAAGLNLALGTVRQTSWLGILVMVPATAWLLRKRRGLAPAGVVLWLAGVAGVLGCVHWYLRQPYSVPEALIDGPVNLLLLKRLGQYTLKIPLTLALFSLPILSAFLWRARGSDFERITRWIPIAAASTVIAGLLLSVLLLVNGHALENLVMPWTGVGNLVSADGILSINQILGEHGTLFPIWLRIVFTLTALYMLVFFAGLVSFEMRRTRESRERQMVSLQELNFLLLPFALAYVGLLLPRAVFSNFIFDRYMTFPLLVVTIYLLRYYQQRTGSRVPWTTVGGIALFSVFGIAGTRDLFSLNRARLAAVNELRRDGVPREQIEGGFEYDGWTQIVDWGYINQAKIINPTGAYHSIAVQPPDPCRYYFLQFTPAVQPRFVLAYDEDCFQPSAYSAIPVSTWLPPYTQKVFVRKLAVD